MVEKLSNLRYNFPEQRILITRKPTSWDLVMKQAKEKQREMMEMKKFKIAEKYHLAKSMKDKTLKNDLKKEQLYLFHRIIASSLSENVRNRFEEFVTSDSKAAQADIKFKRENNYQIKEQHPQGSNSFNRDYPSQNQNNDIFIDEGQQDNEPDQNNMQVDIFADFLKVDPNAPLALHQKISSINQNDRSNGKGKFTLDGPDIAHQSEAQRGQSVVNYFKRYIEEVTVRLSKNDGRMIDQNQGQTSYNEIQELLHQRSLMINRKQCLRKINEDLRKRNKNRGDSGQSMPGLSRQASNLISNSNIQTRSFGSASVTLNNLINSEPQLKPEEAIEVPSIIDINMYTEVQRVKRKKQENFELKWSDEKMEELREANPFFDIKKTKFNDPSLLALYLLKSQEDFHKLFEKSIKTKKNFPGHLKDIPIVKSIFSKDYRWVCQDVQNENIGQQFYYNEFYDREYQLFIMNNSKQKIVKKFIKASDYIFPQNYSNEVDFDERNTGSQTISLGKLFVNPNAYINRKNSRVIYKFHKNQLSAVVKSNSLSENIQNFSRTCRKIGRDHIILLSYLVRRYLSLYGNNWSLITECIRMNICFNHLLLSTEMIQQLYQYVELRRMNLNSGIIKGVKKLSNQNQYPKQEKKVQNPLKFKRSMADRNQQDDITNRAPAELMEIEDDNNFNNIDEDQFGLGSYAENHRNNYQTDFNADRPKLSENMKQKLKKEQRDKVQSSLQTLGRIQLWEKKLLPFGLYTEGSYQKLGQNLQTYSFVDQCFNNEEMNFQNELSKQAGENIKNDQQQKTRSKKTKNQHQSRSSCKLNNQFQQQQISLVKDSKSYERLIKDGEILVQGQQKTKAFRKIDDDYQKYLRLVNLQQESTNNLEQQKISEQVNIFNVNDDFLKMQEQPIENGSKKINKSNINLIGSLSTNSYVRHSKHYQIMQKYMPKALKEQDPKLTRSKLQKHVRSSDSGSQANFAHKLTNQQNSQSLHVHMHRTKNKKIVNQRTSELVRILQHIRKGQNNAGGLAIPGPGQVMMPPARQMPNGMRPQGSIHTSTTGNIHNITLDPSTNGSRPLVGNPAPVNPIAHNPNLPSSVVNTSAPQSNADTQSIKGSKNSARKPTDKEKNDQTPEKKSKPKKRLKKGDDKND